MGSKPFGKTGLLYLAIVLAAINLRPGITSVGPLAGLLETSLNISYTQIGILNTLPLLAFGVISIIVPGLYKKLGLEKVILIGIFCIGIGTYARSLGSWPLLISCTFIMGTGIAICNVAIIPFIKNNFYEQSAVLTGIYTMCMSVFAALGSGFSIPLAIDYGLGWRGALSFWAWFAIVALIVWFVVVNKYNTVPDVKAQSSSKIWYNIRAWFITIFMGLQSLMFYCFAAWGPEILQSKGFSVEESGWAIFYFQIISLPAVFLVPVWAKKEGWMKRIIWAMSLGYLIAFTLLFIPYKPLIYFALALMGWAMGGSISMAYYLINTKTKSARTTIQLSAMAQCIGYLLAAVGPFVVGWVFDWLGNWNIILAGFLGVSLIYTYVSLQSSRNYPLI